MTISRIPVNISWAYGTGSPGVNVWHARYDGPFSGSEQMEGLLSNLQQFYTDIAGIYREQVTISFDGEVTGLGGDEGSTATYDSWSVTGTNTSGPLPTANQIVVGWKTGSGGRSGRGRTFLGPIAGDKNDANGLPTSGVVADIQDAADTLIAAQEGIGDGALGVYSRQDLVVRDFTSATVKREFAVLRSRRD